MRILSCIQNRNDRFALGGDDEEVGHLAVTSGRSYAFPENLENPETAEGEDEEGDV